MLCGISNLLALPFQTESDYNLSYVYHNPDVKSGENVNTGAPDIACTFNILSSMMDGFTFERAIIDIYEVGGLNSSGLITVVLPKDPNFSILPYDNSMTNVGPYTVNNSQWSYDSSDPTFHIWTSSASISALGKSSIGMIFSYNPQGGDGEVTYTTTVIAGSGGEVNSANNVDVESITFFTN